MFFCVLLLLNKSFSSFSVDEDDDEDESSEEDLGKPEGAEPWL